MPWKILPVNLSVFDLSPHPMHKAFSCFGLGWRCLLKKYNGQLLTSVAVLRQWLTFVTYDRLEILKGKVGNEMSIGLLKSTDMLLGF